MQLYTVCIFIYTIYMSKKTDHVCASFIIDCFLTRIDVRREKQRSIYGNTAWSLSIMKLTCKLLERLQNKVHV